MLCLACPCTRFCNCPMAAPSMTCTASTGSLSKRTNHPPHLQLPLIPRQADVERVCFTLMVDDAYRGPSSPLFLISLSPILMPRVTLIHVVFTLSSNKYPYLCRDIVVCICGIWDDVVMDRFLAASHAGAMPRPRRVEHTVAHLHEDGWSPALFPHRSHCESPVRRSSRHREVVRNWALPSSHRLHPNVHQSRRIAPGVRGSCWLSPGLMMRMVCRTTYWMTSSAKAAM